MKFSTDVGDDRLRPLLADFLSITGGMTRWRCRAEILQSEINQNPFLEPHIRERHRLELKFPDFVALVRRRRHLRAQDVREYHDVIDLIVATVELHRSLPPAAQPDLEGKVRHGLQDFDNGLLPLEHELKTLVHLMTKGYDVVPNDLEQRGGFDFLAERHGAVLEVECKTVTRDLGTMVPRRHVRMLYHELKPIFDEFLRINSGVFFLEIKVRERLSANKSVHKCITQSVRRAFEVGSNAARPCMTTVIEASNAIPFNPRTLTYSQLKNFVGTSFGERDEELFYCGNARCSILMVVEGERGDCHLRRLLDNLKKAAKTQLTGCYPGCLVVSFVDMNQEELFQVYSAESPEREHANGLQLVASGIMGRRPNVIEVVYLTPDASYSGIGSQHGFTYNFPNSDHPLSVNDDYHPFRI